MTVTYQFTEFKPRIYQEAIAASALMQNTLVVLPTGLGKTAIATLLMLQNLNKTDKKIVMLAPTKPLVEQHRKTFHNITTVPEEDTVVFTGTIAPAKRQALFAEKRLIFCTPQIIENDVTAGRIRLDDVGLVIVDEAHRSTGNYSYVWVVRQLYAHNPHAHVLAMTASPGADVETLEEVCSNLRIDHIEYRTPQDPDVKPYVEETKVMPTYVTLPDSYAAIDEMIGKIMKDVVVQMKSKGAFAQKDSKYVNKKDLLMLQASLRGQMSQEADQNIFALISLAALAMKVMHAQELVQSQSIEAFLAYASDVEKQAAAGKSKAVVTLLRYPQWRLAVARARETTEKHPKLHKLQDLLVDLFSKNKQGKVIVFSQYRDTLSGIVDFVNTIDGCTAELFLGQAKKKGVGMSQKQQQEVIARFSEGEFNVACMSSVGEEGLDIPSVDAVIFYEPIPSAIRSIQRRGRTGRHGTGLVYTLIAKGTRDEAYRWVAMHKEKNMYTAIDKVKKSMSGREAKQVTLPSVTLETPVAPAKEIKPEYTMYVDNREMHNTAVKLLVERGVGIKMQQLDVADLVLSSEVGIEYKKTQDFVDSILDGRLLDQIKKLKQTYQKPLVLIEGTDLFAVRNVHPSAILGMLATITLSYGIGVVQTTNTEQTAQFLQTVLKREQGSKTSSFSPHASKKPKSVRESLVYTVSSIPGVGSETAKRLLERFSTIVQLSTASVEQLEEVDGVGKKLASDIYMFFRTVWK